jgi:hypothetical protein
MADLAKVGIIVSQIAQLIGGLNEEDLALVKKMIIAMLGDPDKINMISPVYAAQVPAWVPAPNQDLGDSFTSVYSAPFSYK